MNSSLQEDMFYVFGILVVSFVVVQYVVIWDLSLDLRKIHGEKY